MWWKTIVVVIVVLAIVIAVAVLCGTSRWKSDTRSLHERIEATRVSITPGSYDTRELDGLPAPVQRYFRTVLKEGQSLVAAVSVEHTGTFNMSETGEQWKPFTSTQRVIAGRPGFVWDARVRMAPAMTVRVHDAYVAGEGVLTAKLFGLLTVMEQPGTPELAQGELMRFFAEAAWYPTVLLPINEHFVNAAAGKKGENTFGSPCVGSTMPKLACALYSLSWVVGPEWLSPTDS